MPTPDAKTEDGKPVTRLTFREKVRALELQGRALGFLTQGLELKAQGAIRHPHRASSASVMHPAGIL